MEPIDCNLSLKTKSPALNFADFVTRHLLTQDDHENGDDPEVAAPEVELVNVIELDQDDGGEDQDGGSDQEEDVAQVQVLLVLGGLPLHHRQRRLCRAGPHQRHGQAVRGDR